MDIVALLLPVIIDKLPDLAVCLGGAFTGGLIGAKTKKPPQRSE